MLENRLSSRKNSEERSLPGLSSAGNYEQVQLVLKPATDCRKEFNCLDCLDLIHLTHLADSTLTSHSAAYAACQQFVR